MPGNEKNSAKLYIDEKAAVTDVKQKIDPHHQKLFEAAKVYFYDSSAEQLEKTPEQKTAEQLKAKQLNEKLTTTLFNVEDVFKMFGFQVLGKDYLNVAINYLHYQHDVVRNRALRTFMLLRYTFADVKEPFVLTYVQGVQKYYQSPDDVIDFIVFEFDNESTAKWLCQFIAKDCVPQTKNNKYAVEVTKEDLTKIGENLSKYFASQESQDEKLKSFKSRCGGAVTVTKDDVERTRPYSVKFYNIEIGNKIVNFGEIICKHRFLQGLPRSIQKQDNMVVINCNAVVLFDMVDKFLAFCDSRFAPTATAAAPRSPLMGPDSPLADGKKAQTEAAATSTGLPAIEAPQSSTTSAPKLG